MRAEAGLADMAAPSGMTNGDTADVPIGRGSDLIPTLPLLPCPAGVNSPVVVTATCELCCATSLSAELLSHPSANCYPRPGRNAPVGAVDTCPAVPAFHGSKCNSPESVTSPSMQQRISSLGSSCFSPQRPSSRKRKNCHAFLQAQDKPQAAAFARPFFSSAQLTGSVQPPFRHHIATRLLSRAQSALLKTNSPGSPDREPRGKLTVKCGDQVEVSNASNTRAPPCTRPQL